MKGPNLKEKQFDFGKLAQKKTEELSKTPMTKVLYLAVLVSILTILLVILTMGSLPPQIPLFYGLAEGEERLSHPAGLLIPAITALGITIINALIILKIKNDLMQKSLVLASFVVAIFACVTSVKIILLVGSF